MNKILSVILRVILAAGILVVGFLLIVFLAGFFTGLFSDDTENVQSEEFLCIEDFEQANIGIMTGSYHDGTVIAEIAAEKYDMAAASLNITPEREECVDFSDPYAPFDVVMVVKGADKQNSP